MSLRTEHARELAHMPPEWDVYLWDGHRKDGVTYYYEFTGAVAPPKKSGKYKGHPNWAKLDPATKRTVRFTPDEHKAWVAKWVEKTGLCPRCEGDGKVFSSASVTEGTKYRKCPECHGDGKAKS